MVYKGYIEKMLDYPVYITYKDMKELNKVIK